MSAPGSLVISLDFELHWGMHDKWTVEEYKANLDGARAAIDGTLSLFERYQIRATWATVGILFCDGRGDALAHAPTQKPAYDRPNLDPYPLLARCGDDEAADPLHFAPSVVARIASADGQEIGTHTYSHYYALEHGQTSDQFAADIASACMVAERAGVTLSSIVFPRNQVCREYLDVCRKAGIVAYRPNRETWMQTPRPSRDESRFRRALRLTDTYLPLEGDVVRPSIDPSGVVAVPSSRQLRPVGTRRSPLEDLLQRRILAGMRQAATTGAVYHLWWHPHNFGAAVGRNLEQLEVILKHHASLRARHGMRSESMGDVGHRTLAEGAR